MTPTTLISFHPTTSRPTHVYHGHKDDIDQVAWMPNGFTIGTASNDGTCRLFDSRTRCEMARFESVGDQWMLSVDFSLSGRLLFASVSSEGVHGWDTLGNPSAPPVWKAPQTIVGDVRHLGVNSEGRALATTSPIGEDVFNVYS